MGFLKESLPGQRPRNQNFQKPESEDENEVNPSPSRRSDRLHHLPGCSSAHPGVSRCGLQPGSRPRLAISPAEIHLRTDPDLLLQPLPDFSESPISQISGPGFSSSQSCFGGSCSQSFSS